MFVNNSGFFDLLTLISFNISQKLHFLFLLLHYLLVGASVLASQEDSVITHLFQMTLNLVLWLYCSMKKQYISNSGLCSLQFSSNLRAVTLVTLLVWTQDHWSLQSRGIYCQWRKAYVKSHINTESSDPGMFMFLD